MQTLYTVSGNFITERHTMNIGIQKAVEIAGSQAKLGRLVGVTRGQIHQWLNEWSEVPPKKCVLIEIVTGVSRKKLRADWQELWPERAERRLLKPRYR